MRSRSWLVVLVLAFVLGATAACNEAPPKVVGTSDGSESDAGDENSDIVRPPDTDGGRKFTENDAGGWNVSASDGGSDDAATSLPVTGALLSGDSPLIEAFAGDDAIFVVFADEVRAIGRDGETITSWPAPREITAAAYDGHGKLAIADKAKLIVLDADLKELASGTLVEACVGGVIVSGDRFVCGPENDWDRIFYTYDLGKAELLAMSTPYTYNGIPMRRVPGTDDFVTVTVDSSPSDFHLYRVGSDDIVTFINESPYHGDFGATMTFAFDGTPPTHLITHEALMLEIYGADCNSMTNSFTSGCFVKDGALGTLDTGERFLALSEDAAGNVYALVQPAAEAGSFGEPLCTSGCLVQRIDPVDRLVVSHKGSVLHLGSVLFAHHDPVGHTLLLGYTTEPSFGSSTPQRYALSALPYE